MLKVHLNMKVLYSHFDTYFDCDFRIQLFGVYHGWSPLDLVRS